MEFADNPTNSSPLLACSQGFPSLPMQTCISSPVDDTRTLPRISLRDTAGLKGFSALLRALIARRISSHEESAGLFPGTAPIVSFSLCM